MRPQRLHRRPFPLHDGACVGTSRPHGRDPSQNRVAVSVCRWSTLYRFSVRFDGGASDRLRAGVDAGADGGSADRRADGGWVLEDLRRSCVGAVDRRPELDRALEALRPGDTLVVWRLDRLGRSLRHLIDTVMGLDEREVGVGVAAGEHRHDHREGPPGVSPVRGVGAVRAGDHPGPHELGAGGRAGPWPGG
jgi:hypothetical protein